MKTLTLSQLKKYSTRVNAFIDKIYNNSPFESVNGESVLVDHSDLHLCECLEEWRKDHLNPEKYLKDFIIRGSFYLPTKMPGINVPTGKLLKTKEFGGGSKSLVDPTAFEGNLVYALKMFSEGMQAASAFRDIVVNQRNAFISDVEINKKALAIIENLYPVFQKHLGITNSRNQTSCYKLSGLDCGALSDIYKEYGVYSKEPKTDIVFKNIETGNKWCLTVKASNHSQYASAQANEAAAILASVLLKTATEVAREIGEIVQKALQRDVFYGARTKFGGSGNREECMHFYALLNAIFGLGDESLVKSGTCKPLQDHLEYIIDKKMEDAYRQIILSPWCRMAILRECITGENKFAPSDSDAIANIIMAWNYDRPKDSRIQPVTDEWLSIYYTQVKLWIRDRGSNRGGTLRAETTRAMQAILNPQLITNNFSTLYAIRKVIDHIFDLAERTQLIIYPRG